MALVSFEQMPSFFLDKQRLTRPGDISIMDSNFSYRLTTQPFEKLGDSFILVSPGQTILYTIDPEAIHQISARRDHFPKLTEMYQLLALYGQNLLTTEGQVWRLHRKVTSPSFNEKNNARFFGEVITQTQNLITKWLGPDGKGDRTIVEVEEDAMRLSLHAISYVGFGLRLLWPGQKAPKEEGAGAPTKYAATSPPDGYTMTFASALYVVLEKIFVLLLLPKWLIRKLGNGMAGRGAVGR